MTRVQRNILLLTSTITPLTGIPWLARSDPKVRLRDYQSALAFYSSLIGSCFDAIIFAENSGADLSLLTSSFGDRNANAVEFISFEGLNYPPSYGKGYGEFRLVDFAIEQTKLVGENDIVWKITGRYIIENIRKIIQSRPSTADLYCHMRNYPYQLCELYLLGWNSRGYSESIKGVYRKLRNDTARGNISMEEILFRKEVDRAASIINVVPRFRITPVISAVRGWDNRSYSTRWSLKTVARRLSNRLLPGLWI